MKLTRILLCVVVAATCWIALRPVQADKITSQVDLLPPPAKAVDEPPVPQFSEAEKVYLVHLARKALEFSAQTGKRYQEADVPASLRTHDEIAYVTCRTGGRLVGSVAGQGLSLVENIARAAEFVTQNNDFGKDKAAGVRDCVVELEILGPGQKLAWNTLKDVSDSIAPGVHGLAARTVDEKVPDPRDSTIGFKASVAPTHGYVSEEVLHQLMEKAGWMPEQVTAFRDTVTFYRYRALHLLEQAGQPGYVELFRCSELPPTAMTQDRLDRLVGLMGNYLLGRQLNSGLFNYMYTPASPQVDPKSGPAAYVPVTGRYVPDNNSTRQAGAAWALVRLGAALHDARYEVAALKALSAAQLRYLDDAHTAAYTVLPTLDADHKGGEGKPDIKAKLALGQSAMFLLAAVDLSNNQDLAALRDKLAAGILYQQRTEQKTDEDKQLYGSFKVYYSDHPDDMNKFYFPGEAMLALMKAYQQAKDARCLQAVERAFPYYRKLFETETDVGYRQNFIPWQTKAYALAFDATNKAEYRDFIFEMADYQLSFQLDQERAAYPDLVGGFLTAANMAGVGSATYLEGMAEACRIARKAGDTVRADKYAESLRKGARFLDQLTFKDVDAFYCTSKPDVVGGVKSSVVDHSIRIDNQQHAALALIDIREQLFPAKAP